MSEPTFKAYAHFGGAGTPMLTEEVPMKIVEITPNSTTGYGARVNTPYMVRIHGEWRRVYSMNFGNWPSLYVGKSWQTRLAHIDIHWFR